MRADERAAGGRANKRLLEILAEHFKIPKSQIMILRGAKTRSKTIEVGMQFRRKNHRIDRFLKPLGAKEKREQDSKTFLIRRLIYS